MQRSSILLVLACCACSAPDPVVGQDAGTNDAAVVEIDAAPRDAGPPPIILGTDDRPVTVVVPPAHDGTTELPLVVLLHGYSVTGGIQDLYFGMSALARDRGFYLLAPDGTVDASGQHFWNAQPACCDFGHTDVDDVGYITSLIDQAEAALPIDPTRIYLIGHSNGGFMSYRLACEIGERIAAIGVLAGGDFPEVTDCVPPRAVSVLHMHGTMDATISYGGVAGASGFAGAVESTERWATRAGCDMTAATTGAAFDFDTRVTGDEAVPTEYESGCAGAVVTLWTLNGSGHIPALARDSAGRAVDWLLARSAPAP